MIDMKITSNLASLTDCAQPHAAKSRPRIERAEVINDGKHIAAFVREGDGTISAIRISVEQLAD